jgi:hypothetical protein
MQKSTIQDTYNLLLGGYRSESAKVAQRIRLLSISRFALFMAVLYLFYAAITNPVPVNWSAEFAGIAVFIWLMHYQDRQQHRLSSLKALVQTLTMELEALTGNHGSFGDGSTFIDHAHPYSFDLDLFGCNSLYQRVNRTTSEGGASTLADALTRVTTDKEQILQRQEAIKELAGKHSFRIHFRATGLVAPLSAKMEQQVKDWLEERDGLRIGKVLSLMLYILPACTLTTFVLWIAGVLPYSVPSLFGVIQLLLVYSRTKQINTLHQALGNKYRTIDTISKSLRLIEEETLEAPLLRDLCNRLAYDGHSAGKIFARLSAIMQRLDSRMNILGTFLMNLAFMYELHVVKQLLDFRHRYGSTLASWFGVLFEMETLSGFGTYTAHHPGYAFPVISDKSFLLSATSMGHPLLTSRKVITNNITMDRTGHMIVLTGSNMSGKSTFLRSTGISWVMAHTGLPVCAESFTFTPAPLYTSMRINDSLQENESYFYAELKRLQFITREAGQDIPMLILLDEILRGTNSNDKHTGSEALLKKLAGTHVAGILATHDVMLGKLEQEQPAQFSNYCFESQLTANELTFDYTIRKGVCRNMNAVFLMKKMGIVNA